MFKQTVIGLTCLLLGGCASSSLDRAVSQCIAENGKPSYTRTDSTEKFACL